MFHPPLSASVCSHSSYFEKEQNIRWHPWRAIQIPELHLRKNVPSYHVTEIPWLHANSQLTNIDSIIFTVDHFRVLLLSIITEGRKAVFFQHVTISLQCAAVYLLLECLFHIMQFILFVAPTTQETWCLLAQKISTGPWKVTATQHHTC